MTKPEGSFSSAFASDFSLEPELADAVLAGVGVAAVVLADDASVGFAPGIDAAEGGIARLSATVVCVPLCPHACIKQVKTRPADIHRFIIERRHSGDLILCNGLRVLHSRGPTHRSLSYQPAPVPADQLICAANAIPTHAYVAVLATGPARDGVSGQMFAAAQSIRIGSLGLVLAAILVEFWRA